MREDTRRVNLRVKSSFGKMGRLFLLGLLVAVVVLSSLGGRTVQADVDYPVTVPTYLKLWDDTTKTFAESEISSPLFVNVGDTITVGLFFENNATYQDLPSNSNSQIFRSWEGMSYYFLSNDDATSGLNGLSWEKSYLAEDADDSVNGLLFEKPYSYNHYDGTWDTIMTVGQWNNAIDSLAFNSHNWHGSGGTGKYYVDTTKFLIGMLMFTVTEDMFGANGQFSLYNAGFMQWRYHDSGGVSWTVKNSSTDEPWVLGTFQEAVVPEPGTWAMLAGLSLVGGAWICRRRRK